MKKYAAFIVIALGLALVHLFIFTGSVGLKYDSVKLKMEFNRSLEDNRQLRCLVSKGESLNRVEKIALSKLNMEYPESVQYAFPRSMEAE